MSATPRVTTPVRRGDAHRSISWLAGAVGGGGSSDAVAALIGALTVLLAAENRDLHDHHDRRGPWADWPPQVYCGFFAGYLTALDLGGCGGPSSPATRRSSPSSSPDVH